MNWQPSEATRPDNYGRRARIGYVCPPLLAEIFPYEFYQIVPDGVTLVITNLSVVDRSKNQLDQAYEMSMRAARELAAAGVDIVVLGGVPVNQSRGRDNADTMLLDLEVELGVKVSSSMSAQAKAAKVLGCNKVVVAHPYGDTEAARLMEDARRYGCEVLGAAGLGSDLGRFGRLPVSAALELGRALIGRYPDADSIFFPSPHWPVVAAIEPLEREFGVKVMTAAQACIWDALRCVGVTDRIEGYGRLFREF